MLLALKGTVLIISSTKSNIGSWNSEKLRVKLEKKFNQLGWFKCIPDKNGRYQELQFGDPIQFESFIALVKKGLLICDCGMHSQNKRPYMSWRAQKNIWNSLAEK